MDFLYKLFEFFKSLFPFDQLSIGVSVSCFLVGFFVAIGYLVALTSEEAFKGKENILAIGGFSFLFFILFSFINIAAASLFIGHDVLMYCVEILEIVLLLLSFAIIYIKWKRLCDYQFKVNVRLVRRNGMQQQVLIQRPLVSRILKIVIFISFGVFSAVVMTAKIIVFILQ